MQVPMKVNFRLWVLLVIGQFLMGCGSNVNESTTVSEPDTTSAQTGSAEQIVLAIGGESEEGYDRFLSRC
jgi:hypothetical protein